MEDYTCVYAKHNCELRAEQLSRRTYRDRIVGFFKGIFLISQSNFRSYLYLRSKGAIQLEIIRQKNSKHWYIVHPFSLLRLCWDILMMFVLLFAICFFPFKSAFLNPLVARYYLAKGRSTKNICNALLIDFSLNITWLLNTFGYFVTGYYDQISGRIVMDPRAIFKKYFVPGFILDLTSCVPVEALVMFCCGLRYLSKMNQACFISLQVYNLYSTVKFRYYITYLSKIQSLGNFSYLTVRILFAFVIYFWILNWSIYFSLIVPLMVYGERLLFTTSNETLSWAQATGLFEMDLLDQYKISLLKSLFTNIGVSTWNNLFAIDDYILAVIICILSRIYWIYFLIWFLEAITSANALKAKFILILEQLKAYMKQKEVPVFLKKRLNRFYFYRFQAHYFRDRAILAKLTESLRKEISMYTCEKLIHNTEVFQSLPRRVVARLVQRMNREMYFPNDVIIRANTFGECMYFICSGTVAVWTASEKEICRLEDGDFFGEIALIVEDSRRIATVTAVTITEVYRLEVSDYKKIILLYPDVYNQLERIAALRFRTLVSMEEK